MRYAVFAITAKGIEKAAEVAAVLVAEGHSVQAYFKAGRMQECHSADSIINSIIAINGTIKANGTAAINTLTDTNSATATNGKDSLADKLSASTYAEQDVELYSHSSVSIASDFVKGKITISEYTRLSSIMESVFCANYDGLIFIMATGIVVRSIAPYIVSKLRDPAVLVMDEAGRHIISLLSGHIGGANALTVYLADKLHSDPVITTATDVNNILAPDSIAQRLELVPYPKAAIEVFNSGLLAGKQLEYILDADIECVAEYKRRLNLLGVDCRICNITQQPDIAGTSAISANTVDVNSIETLAVVVTDRKKLFKDDIVSATPCNVGNSQNGVKTNANANFLINGELALNRKLPLNRNLLYLYPRRLAAGIGCKRDTPMELIASAVEEACKKIGWPMERIDLLASTVVKQNEQGLLEFASAVDRQITFYENEKLQEVIDRYSVEESAFVKKTIGIGNVSEAAALACFESGRVALPKTKYERVTVSLVWEK